MAQQQRDVWPSGGRFDPPAYLNDLGDNGKASWSVKIKAMLDYSTVERDGEMGDNQRKQWFNPLYLQDSAKPADLITQVAKWTAFPNMVNVASGSNEERWRRADADRKVQDEYCEWSVTCRDVDNKITRVTFTCERPEYWNHMADVDPEKLLFLYREMIGPEVTKDDLFNKDGTYNGENKWNCNTKTGAVHLIQKNNTLGTEVELGGGATVVRAPGGEVITDSQRLINCSRYGQPTRNSDPSIGSTINSLARVGYKLSLINPVAIYFEDPHVDNWKTPDKTNPHDFWKIERGEPGMARRCVYEVPKDKDYDVGDITFAPDECITYGSQIADFIRVKLTGMAYDMNPKNVNDFKYCKNRQEKVNFADFDPAMIGSMVGRRL